MLTIKELIESFEGKPKQEIIKIIKTEKERMEKEKAVKVYCKAYGSCGKNICCKDCNEYLTCSTSCNGRQWKGCQGMVYEDDNGRLISKETYIKLKKEGK